MLAFKLLEALLLPSGLSLLLILWGLFEKKRRRVWLVLAGAFIYWFFSMAPVAYHLVSSLERRVLKPEGVSADTVLLLRGGPETDRLRADGVLKLVRERPQEIKTIIIAGVNPLRSVDQGGYELKRYLMERGVKQDILVESQSRNTYENAVANKVTLGERPFFLVTSAYHMPRAEETFRENGLNPVPYPVDFKDRFCCSLLDIVPDPSSLQLSNRALHEYLGRLYYQFQYY